MYIRGKRSASEYKSGLLYWENYPDWYHYIYYSISEKWKSKLLFDPVILDVIDTIGYSSYHIFTKDIKREQKFIMMIGVQSSGKSTLTSRISKNGFTVISSDNIRNSMYPNTKYSDIDNGKVFELVNKKTVEALKKGENVIYDATNLRRKHRIYIMNLIKSINCNKIAIISAPTELEMIKRRNKMRNNSVPDEVISRAVRAFQPPFFYEGFDYIIPSYFFEVDKEPDSDEIFDDGLNWDQIMKFDQNNHHHMYTLGGHIETVQSYIEERTPNYPWLIDAAIYHDVGKLYTKTNINRKGEVTEESHYYNHENYSAYWLLSANRKASIKAIRKFINENGAYDPTKFSTDYIQVINSLYCRFVYDLYVSNLCGWHMNFYREWKDSERVRERDKELIGITMFIDLISLQAADKGGKDD